MTVNDPDHFSFIGALAEGNKWYKECRDILAPLHIETVEFRVDPFIWHYSGKINSIGTIWDSEKSPILRLRNMILIGAAFGIHSWKREFDDGNGTFYYTAEVEEGDRKIMLRCHNASQGKCKVIKKVEMVERISYTADCSDEDPKMLSDTVLEVSGALEEAVVDSTTESI